MKKKNKFQWYDTSYFNDIIKKRKQRDPIGYYLTRLKRRAKERNIPFNLNREDIIIPSVCPILGIPLIISTKVGEKRTENTFSIDCVDNTKGYTKDNIIVCSWRANRIKNDGTVEEHRKIVEFLNKS